MGDADRAPGPLLAGTGNAPFPATTVDLPAGSTRPAGPQAGPLARAAVRRQLRAWSVEEETAFTAELVAGELVANAVPYGAPPFRLRLIRDGSLTCEVSDTSPSTPHVKHARTIDESGRGPFIVASLTDSWGTRYHARGKTVWAEQPAETT
ncbi:ATP-binding protein [Streptomyces puniciscabiei]|uniref:ATP-binding protein n=1 Tax=Streptomyces puniciscabiei TaxID=164348 RepID=UPI0033230E3E